MTDYKFKRGDIVVLNSGGPFMTVMQAETDWVKCIWFDEPNSGFKVESFHQDCVYKNSSDE